MDTAGLVWGISLILGFAPLVNQRKRGCMVKRMGLRQTDLGLNLSVQCSSCVMLSKLSNLPELQFAH